MQEAVLGLGILVANSGSQSIRKNTQNDICLRNKRAAISVENVDGMSKLLVAVVGVEPTTPRI
jgi:hypothetical protein